MTEILTALSPKPLDVSAAIAAVTTPECGGIGVFIGTVRSSAAAAGNERIPVVSLDYEAHPDLAPRRIREVCEEAASRFHVQRITAVHRTGLCELGEPTVVIACSAAHRKEALEACRWIIDEVKATVPIWKREIYADGSSWVGAQA